MTELLQLTATNTVPRFCVTQACRTMLAGILFAASSMLTAQQSDALAQGPNASSAASSDSGSMNPSRQLFLDHVATVLAARCVGCHNDQKSESDYRMAHIDQLFQAGASGELPIQPKHAMGSELYRRLISDDVSLRMPPDSDPLPQEEIAAIAHWIDSGAVTPDDRQQTLSQIADEADRRRPAPEHYARAIPINALAWSADGASIFAAGQHEVTQWRVADSQLVARFGQLGQRIASIATSLDGQWMAISSGIPGQSGAISVHSLASPNQPRIVYRDSDIPASIAIAPNSNLIAIAGSTGLLVVFELDSGKRVFQSAAHADTIQSVQWSDDGTQLMTASRDRTAKSLRVEGWQWLAAYDKHERAVGGVARINTGTVTLDETGKLRVWPVDNGEYTIATRDGYIRRLMGIQSFRNQVLVPVGTKIVRTKIEWRDVDDGKDKEGKPKTRKQGEWDNFGELVTATSSPILAVAVHASSLVAAGTADGHILVWKLESDKPEQPIATIRAVP